MPVAGKIEHMNPQQPGYDPYQFITNPQASKPSMFGGDNSMRKRLFVVVGGGIGLLLLGIIAWGLISSIGNEDFNDLVRVGQAQQKIVYTSDLLLDSGSSPNTLAYASTLKSTVASDYASLERYLESRGKDDETKRIGSGKDTKIEDDLEAAVQSGRLDDVFYQTIDKLLADYSQAVKNAAVDAKKTAEKNLIDNFASDVASFQKARN